MKSFAYLSVLLVPLLFGIGILTFLIVQIVRDQKKEGAEKRRVGPFVFALVFWILFGGFYVWRTLPTGP